MFNTSQGPRGLEYNSSRAQSQRKQRYLSTDTRIKGCLKKASTNTTRSKRRGLLPGNRQGTPGQRGTQHHRRHRGSPAPGLQGSNVDCSGRSGKTIKGENKAGEYLIYPRVLRPATKLLCGYQMERGRLYSGLQDRNTRVRGNMLGLSKTSIFRRVLQHEVRISQQFIQQKLLQHCIIVSYNHN